MNEKITRVGKFVKKHKLPILVGAGVAVGFVIGYQYYAHKLWAPQAPLPGHLKINLDPDSIRWLHENNGRYLNGDFTTGIVETVLIEPPRRML